MYNNYFYLKRSAKELNNLLQNSVVLDIYTQEKNKLNLHIPSGEYPDRHLIISTNPQSAYLLLKREHHKARKNTINFLNNLLPDKLLGFEIAARDRIIKIIFEKFLLVFIVRGPKTNILFKFNSDKIQSFKKINNRDELINEFAQLDFINPSEPYKLEKTFDDDCELKDIRKAYPNISKDIYENAKILLLTGQNSSLIDAFESTFNEILNGSITIGFDKNKKKVRLIPSVFPDTKNLIYNSSSKSFNEALQNYLSLHFRLYNKIELKKEIEKFLTKDLERIANKLNNLKNRIERGSKETEYNKIGGLLLSNRAVLHKGMEQVSLTDYSSGNTLKIKLDPKKSVQSNIDKYFEKSRDERINYRKSIELFDNTQKRYDYLLSISNKLKNLDDIDELKKIKKELKITASAKMQNDENKHRFRHFLIDSKYHVFVGRDSKENDYLSIKFAKQNDYWFHARGLPGSHVILRLDNPKEPAPKNILKNAASIAAFYSKGKTAGLTPVSYTFAKFVHKKKGMEPGKVLISKEKVLLVKPEIPKNCEQLYE